MPAENSFPTLNISFAPAWWHARYVMDFGEQAWQDPLARTERDREMRRLLFERFGEVGLGEQGPAPRPNLEAYGDRFMAALWGCEIRYFPDQAPAAVPVPNVRERMENLEVPDLASSPVIRQALEDARLLEERYGWCEGSINLGGPLNNAVSVFGEEILSACLAEPKLARRTLQKMAEALLAVHDQVVCRINGVAVTSPRPAGGLGNCPVCMISPQTYREVVLPADLWFRNQFREFGLHHCGSFHPYNEVYQELRPDSLDVGWETDRRATRRAFPHTAMSLMLEASALVGTDQVAIDDLIARMVEDGGPPELITRIWVAEAGPDLPDETVRSLMTVPQRLG